MYYNSSTKKAISKTQWIEKVKADYSDYWNKEEGHVQRHEDELRNVAGLMLQSLTSTKGEHSHL